MAIASTAIPPTTPPTMAPVFELLPLEVPVGLLSLGAEDVVVCGNGMVGKNNVTE